MQHVFHRSEAPIEAEGAYHEAGTERAGEHRSAEYRDRDHGRHDNDDDHAYGKRPRGGFLGDILGGD